MGDGESRLDLYADGGVVKVNPSPYAGTWAFVVVLNGIEIIQHSGVVLPKDGVDGKVSNNVTELFALVRAIEYLYETWGDMADQAHIYSDSKVSLLRVFERAKLNNVPAWLVQRLQAVQDKGCASLPYTLLDGHPTRDQLKAGKGKRGNPVSIYNATCDRLCTEAGAAHMANGKG